MLRTRALSALVLVPPLLIALLIGVPALAVLLAVVAALGGIEAFRLLRMAGYPSMSLFGTILAVAIVLEVAVHPGGTRGSSWLGSGPFSRALAPLHGSIRETGS